MLLTTVKYLTVARHQLTRNKLMDDDKEATIGIKTRTIIWYLAFFGFAINFVLSYSVSFAIIYMINSNDRADLTNQSVSGSPTTSQCIIERNITNSSGLYNEITSANGFAFDAQYVSLERKLLSLFNVSRVCYVFN